MKQTQRDLDTERAPTRIIYHRSTCRDHPSPERPWACPPESDGHHRNRAVLINESATGDTSEADALFEQITPDACDCGASVESATRVIEWPPIPITGDAAFRLFDRTDGHVVLELEPLSYPEEAVDWQGVLDVDDPVRDETWYAGQLGDAFLTRTERSRQSIWASTEVTPDEFGVLLRALPSTPKSIWDSTLEASLEDYHAGHDLTEVEG